MSERYEDREALAAIVEWEGGILGALDYGIRAEHMPEGDAELAALWERLESAYRVTDLLADDARRLLDAQPGPTAQELAQLRADLADARDTVRELIPDECSDEDRERWCRIAFPEDYADGAGLEGS